MSKLLGLAGLFILTRELTKGVSPKTVGPSPPTNGLTPEEKERQAERERERKKADAESVERERLLDFNFRQEMERITNNPPDCGEGKKPVRKGAGTRIPYNPYYWFCELKRFGL